MIPEIGSTLINEGFLQHCNALAEGGKKQRDEKHEWHSQVLEVFGDRRPLYDVSGCHLLVDWVWKLHRERRLLEGREQQGCRCRDAVGTAAAACERGSSRGGGVSEGNRGGGELTVVTNGLWPCSLGLWSMALLPSYRG
ncbi:hypothetical protein GW17_00055315 [Ensete ventricosum]|nr:hypothetical protein GW17_00055315 [Ensete ventricosum]RZR85503.1 hypothetical protein BHM03_00012506 [Ensete ventricosum]